MDTSLLLELAGRYGTPTYLYDLPRIRARVAELRRLLPQAQLRYAVKANPNGAVLRTLAELGVGAEVITLGELERAHRAGIPGARLLLGGPRQDAAMIDRALELGVGSVSLDGAGQWPAWSRRRLQGVRFFVRVNPGLDPRTHEHLATGAATSKFGLPPAAALALALELAEAGLLAGFHVHAGSMIRDLAVYDEIFAVLAPLYRAVEARVPSWTGAVRQLDLGGGLAVPDFPLREFSQRVGAFAAELGAGLVLEPGRWLTADAGVLLTRVLHVKEAAPPGEPGEPGEPGPPGNVRHVIADAGMAELLRPALYGAQHPVRTLTVGGKPTPPDTGLPPAELQPADVDGPLCENADRLARNVPLPAVAPGDLLAVEQVGAYGFTMASNYASSLRPAEVAVDGKRHWLARRRETVDDLLAAELTPSDPEPDRSHD